jgi:hypothetical protein
VFELVLAAIRRGDYQDIEHTLWVAAHGPGQRRPAWAAELLAAYLADRPHALDLDDLGNVVALRSTEMSR